MATGNQRSVPSGNADAVATTPTTVYCADQLARVFVSRGIGTEHFAPEPFTDNDHRRAGLDLVGRKRTPCDKPGLEDVKKIGGDVFGREPHRAVGDRGPSAAG